VFLFILRIDVVCYRYGCQLFYFIGRREKRQRASPRRRTDNISQSVVNDQPAGANDQVVYTVQKLPRPVIHEMQDSVAADPVSR